MKNTWLLTLLFTILSICNYSQTISWLDTFTGPQLTENCGVTTDAVGNVYMSGFFSSSSVFGTNTLTSIGSDDAVIVKTNQAGNVIWAKSFGGSSPDRALAITSDGSSNIFTTGYYSGTVVFGAYTLTSSAGSMFVCKMDTSGNVIWAKSYADQGGSIAYAIHYASNGSIYITGEFSNSCTLGTNTVTSMGGTDAILIKIDNLGNMVWYKTIGGASQDAGKSITTDNVSNVYVTGTFNGTASVTASGLLNSNGNNDAFVVKLSPSGNVLSKKNFGGSSYDVGASIYSKNNILYMGGTYNGTFTLGTHSCNLNGMYIARIDTATLNVIWANSFESNYPLYGITSITSDAVGNVYSGGYFEGIVTFGSTLTAALLSSSTMSADGFISKLDAAGDFVWVKQLQGPNSELVYGLTMLSGKLYVGGIFSNAASIDSFTLNTTSPSLSAFLLKLDPGDVGIKENIKELNAFVYPNPTNDKLFIEVKNPSEELYYSLIEVAGKELIHKKRITSTESIDVSRFAKGVYFLQLETNSQTVMRKIVVE